MSEEVPTPPTEFTGPDRYIDAAEDWFEVTLTKEQKEILRSVAENQYTLVQSANGAGKTFSTVCLALSFFFRHYPSSVVVTSGTYGKLKRTFCADAEKLHINHSPFGEWKWSPNPHLDIEDTPEWQMEVASPEDAGELEGIHNENLLAVVEEADKDGVDEQVIDSMDSLLSDEQDKMLVICNPPEDESNVVYDLANDPNYNMLQYSTFDSHNVQVERGNREGQKVMGLAGLTKLKKKWRSFNNEEWPGYDTAKNAHLERDDLDTRWYRRFAGVMPPEGASKYKPFSLSLVKEGYDQSAEPSGDVISMGLDVARDGGDFNVLTLRYPDHYEIAERWQGVDHNAGYRLMTGYCRRHPVPVAVDAQGEGSGLADRLMEKHEVIRFKSQEQASQSGKFKDKWAEGLFDIGQFLKDEGTFSNSRLNEEMCIAARIVQFKEKHYSSRNATVLKATPKRKIKKELGRSPDVLDSVLMAEWATDRQQSLLW